jgi:hypothetical protein
LIAGILEAFPGIEGPKNADPSEGRREDKRTPGCRMIDRKLRAGAFSAEFKAGTARKTKPRQRSAATVQDKDFLNMGIPP